MSEGEGAEETEREQEMRDLRGGRDAGAEEGAQKVLEGLPRGTAGTGGAAEVAEAGVNWCAE